VIGKRRSHALFSALSVTQLLLVTQGEKCGLGGKRLHW
jgi:hypothetical protein